MRTKRGRFSTAPFYGEDKTLGKRILGWFRRDAVLTVSLCLAVLSCLIEPPGPGYLNYIDFNTLITLFCLMLLVEGLREEQFLQYVAARVLSRAGSVRGLMVTLVFLCFVGSMLITNDVALITFVPLGMMMLEMASQRKRLCFAVALMTVAANLGSMFTPIGNPQNLYLFSLSGLSLPEFLGLTAPYTAARPCCSCCASASAADMERCPSAWERRRPSAGVRCAFIWPSFCCVWRRWGEWYPMWPCWQW